MMGRGKLMDCAWATIEPLLPRSGQSTTGRWWSSPPLFSGSSPDSSETPWLDHYPNVGIGVEPNCACRVRAST